MTVCKSKLVSIKYTGVIGVTDVIGVVGVVDVVGIIDVIDVTGVYRCHRCAA